MKVKNDTVLNYVEDALLEIRKIKRKCKDNSLHSEELLVWMEHALHMFNAAVNLRFYSRDRIAKMSQDEWERYLNPPKEIFGRDRYKKYREALRKSKAKKRKGARALLKGTGQKNIE